jgi:uncharacterized membrane protein
VGVLLAFIATVIAFGNIAAAGVDYELIGADLELGYPSVALSLGLFSALLSIGMARLAGTILSRGAWAAITALGLTGVVVEGWVLFLNFDWFVAGLLTLMVAAVVTAIRNVTAIDAPIVVGLFLVPASIAGFFAAFRLTVDKVGTYIDPTTAPTCDLNLLVQCGTNLKSWQGSLFGFPNPVIGLIGWIAPLVVGILLLAGLSFARWFWVTFNVGVALALVFVIWLISQSIFSLGTLCPWCMVTWSVVIPMFWLVTLYNLREGRFGLSERARSFFAGAFTYVPFITLVSYIAVAVIAQLRLDFLSYL